MPVIISSNQIIVKGYSFCYFHTSIHCWEETLESTKMIVLQHTDPRVQFPSTSPKPLFTALFKHNFASVHEWISQFPSRDPSHPKGQESKLSNCSFPMTIAPCAQDVPVSSLLAIAPQAKNRYSLMNIIYLDRSTTKRAQGGLRRANVINVRVNFDGHSVWSPERASACRFIRPTITSLNFIDRWSSARASWGNW